MDDNKENSAPALVVEQSGSNNIAVCTPKRKHEAIEANHESDSWETPWIAMLPLTEYESKEQRCAALSTVESCDELRHRSTLRLHDEIVAFNSYIHPTDEESKARQLVITNVTSVVKQCFTECEVVMFGSAAQGLSLPGGYVP